MIPCNDLQEHTGLESLLVMTRHDQVFTKSNYYVLEDFVCRLRKTMIPAKDPSTCGRSVEHCESHIRCFAESSWHWSSCQSRPHQPRPPLLR